MLLALFIVLVLLGVIAIYPLHSKKIGVWVYVCLGIIFLAIAIFKDGSILWDYDSYINLLKNYQIVPIEPTFYWISALIHTYLGGESLYLFAIYAALGISLKMVAIYRTSNFIVLSLLIYFCHFFISQELIQIRAGVAGGFFLLSLQSLYQRKMWKYLSFIVAGTLFHTSLLLTLPLYFLNTKSINKYFYLGILIVGYVVCIFKIEFLAFIFKIVTLGRWQQQYEGYMDITDSLAPVSIFSFQQLLKLGCICLIMIKLDLIAPHCRQVYLWLKIMIISLALVPLLHENSVIALRVRDVFGIVEIFLFPLLVYVFTKRQQGYVFCCGLALLLYFVSYLEMSPFHALR